MTTSTAVVPKIYTIADYEAITLRPDNTERRYELIHGEIVEKVPTEEHGTLAAWIAHLLLTHVRPGKLGRVAVEPRHHSLDDNFNARLPDVAFTRAERILPLVKQGSVPQMPDLAIEIHSPGDRPHAMREKALYYLQKGSTLVLLFYPASASLEVCSLDQTGAFQIASLAGDGTLDLGSILPGVQIPIRDFFDIE